MPEIKEPVDDFSLLFNINEEEKIRIDSLLNKMTIRERVAQMIMPWAGGNFTSDSSREYKRIKYLVEDLKVGGLIFFKGDITNEAIIINKAQSLAEVPLLISSDFERGLAMRLTDATEFPYNMALAATGNPLFAQEMGKVISLESRAIGIHQNYAPVADINNNADNPIINIRSYSEDKNIVAEFCEAFIKGSIKGRMISTVKHFPGHGNTQVDSHQDMPVISGTREELFENELDPFIHAIKTGVHSVMIGHLSVPAFEPERIPATLSKKIITDLLKEELNFKGLIVTDAMNMNAVTKYYSAAEAAVMAVKAGNDIILMPPDEDIAVFSVADAVYKGEIPVERINESVRKILAAKIWTGVDKERMTNIEQLPFIVGSRKNVFLAEEIAEKSITLIKNDDNLIPLDPEKFYTTAVISVTDNVSEGEFFNELADQEFGYIKTISLGKMSTEKDYEEAVNTARSSDIIIIPSFIKVKAYAGSVKMLPEQADLINKILKLNKPSVIISFGNPYLLSMFPDCKTYITAYGDAAVSQKAAVRAITGKSDITGVLPISIPGTGFSRGSGINISRNVLIPDAEGYDLPEAAKIISGGLQNKIFSGASLLVSMDGKVIYNNGFGRTDFNDKVPLVNKEFIYDQSEITYLAATAAAMVLCTEGKISPEDKLLDHMSDIKNNNLLVKDLFVPFDNNEDSSAGSENIYINTADVLQKLIEKVSGTSLDKFLHKKIFKPLNMKRTAFNPPKEFWFYVLPTKNDFHRRYKGVVYDDDAFSMHGVTGHAGLFTTPEDMAVFLQMLQQKGRYGQKQIISEDVFNSWYRIPGSVLWITGKTGTSVRLDLQNKISIVFFTNSSFTGKIPEFRSLNNLLNNSITDYIKY